MKKKHPESDMSDKKEASLIKRIQRQGDRQAAETLISAYYREIYAFAYRQTSDVDAAMDLTQEIFLAALQSIQRYDPKRAGFRTWLYRIASHKLTDLFRSPAYRLRQSTIPIEELSLPDDGSPEEQWLEADQLRQIQLRIADLPDEIQSILRLRFYGEAGFRQIAEILALPEGTVKTKYYAAIRTLRKEANRQ
ncbi:MAG: RNA polymerase sigma factor [Oscillospiraceae bacterium]|nr:RNA polymerase sigma factor [Oscillospiraceae bacterium]